MEQQIASLHVQQRSGSHTPNRHADRYRSSSWECYDPNGRFCYFHIKFGKKCLLEKCKQLCSWQLSAKHLPTVESVASHVPKNVDCRSYRLFVHDKKTGIHFLVQSDADFSLVPENVKAEQPCSYVLYAVNGTQIPTYHIKALALDLGLRCAFYSCQGE